MQAVEILVPVWGDFHLDVFLNFSLPFQLAPGNLPALAQKYKIKYRIYTNPSCWRLIKNSRIFDRVSEIAEIDMVDLTFMGQTDRYALASSCYLHGINNPLTPDPIFIFLTAHHCWANGSFAKAIVRIESGYRAVAIAGPRVIIDSATVLIDELAPRQKTEEPISLNGRQLSQIMVRSLLNPSSRNVWPANLYWRVADEGFISKSFVVHPFIMHKPDAVPTSVVRSIDTSLFCDAFQSREAIYFAEDSDEMVEISLARASEITNPIPSHFYYDLEAMGRWFEWYGNGWHWRNLSKTFLFHTNGTTGGLWARQIKEAEAFAKSALDELNSKLLFKCQAKTRFGHYLLRVDDKIRETLRFGLPQGPRRRLRRYL